MGSCFNFNSDSMFRILIWMRINFWYSQWLMRICVCFLCVWLNRLASRSWKNLPFEKSHSHFVCCIGYIPGNKPVFTCLLAVNICQTFTLVLSSIISFVCGGRQVLMKGKTVYIEDMACLFCPTSNYFTLCSDKYKR